MEIGIVYLATGSYIQYFEAFKETLNYFFPGYQKKVTIISDALDEYDGVIIKDTVFQVKKIINLPYPMISYFKQIWILELLDFKSDYYFYFDADTMFREVPNYDWKELIQVMSHGPVFNLHPFYDLYLNGRCEQCDIDSFNEYNTERCEDMQCYIPYGTEYDYIIGSFFAGSGKDFKSICEKIKNDITQDLKLSRDWKIPRFFDENYLNHYALHHKCSKRTLLVMNEYGIGNEQTFGIQKNLNPEIKIERIKE